MKKPRQRIDQLLLERGLAPSLEKAKAILMTGIVFVSDCRVDKAGTLVAQDATVELRDRKHPFASRGGFKLEKALDFFGLDVTSQVIGDFGASTGGFTDCLLQRGAKKVYAIDVGHGLLDCKLANDPRVVVMDRTNARLVRPEMFAELLDLATMDLSFISLELILPAIAPLIAPTGLIVCLIKPQFEAGAENVARGGVVRDASVHAQVLEKLLRLAEGLGLENVGLTYSPIKGPAGNIEFLAGFRPIGAESRAEGVLSSLASEARLSMLDSAGHFNFPIVKNEPLGDRIRPQVRSLVEATWLELNHTPASFREDKSAD